LSNATSSGSEAGEEHSRSDAGKSIPGSDARRNTRGSDAGAYAPGGQKKREKSHKIRRESETVALFFS